MRNNQENVSIRTLHICTFARYSYIRTKHFSKYTYTNSTQFVIMWCSRRQLASSLHIVCRYIQHYFGYYSNESFYVNSETCDKMWINQKAKNPNEPLSDLQGNGSAYERPRATFVRFPFTPTWIVPRRAILTNHEITFDAMYTYV